MNDLSFIEMSFIIIILYIYMFLRTTINLQIYKWKTKNEYMNEFSVAQ